MIARSEPRLHHRAFRIQSKCGNILLVAKSTLVECLHAHRAVGLHPRNHRFRGVCCRVYPRWRRRFPARSRQRCTSVPRFLLFASRQSPGSSRVLLATSRCRDVWSVWPSDARDSGKVQQLSKQADDLGKTLGPEFIRLNAGLEDMDPQSKDGQEVSVELDKLDKLCPTK